MYDLEVASPNPVDPIPVIISKIAFSVEAAATLTYH